MAGVLGGLDDAAGVVALDVLHRDVIAAAAAALGVRHHLVEVEHGHEVRVLELGRGPRLLDEQLLQLGITTERLQDELERHRLDEALAALGPGGPDLRHAAYGNALTQHVLADALTWLHGIYTPGARPEVKRGE